MIYSIFMHRFCCDLSRFWDIFLWPTQLHLQTTTASLNTVVCLWCRFSPLFIFAFWCHVLSVHPYSCDPPFMIDTLHLRKTADGSLLLKNAAPSAFRIGFRITWKLVNLLSCDITNLLDAIFRIETGVGFLDNIFFFFFFFFLNFLFLAFYCFIFW